MATEMQLRFYLEKNRMAGRTFRKKTQRQSRVLFDVIFDVYTHVDNRERARASDWKQNRRILSEEKHENSKRRGWWVVSASGKRVQILMGL